MHFALRKNSTNNGKVADGVISTPKKSFLQNNRKLELDREVMFIFIVVYQLKTKVPQIGSYNFLECITANYHHHSCHCHCYLWWFTLLSPGLWSIYQQFEEFWSKVMWLDWEVRRILLISVSYHWILVYISWFVSSGLIHVSDPVSPGVGWDSSFYWIPCMRQQFFYIYKWCQALI